MASVVEFRRWALGIAAIASSAVLIWFGNGLFPAWPLMWFAVLPVLLFSLGSSGWSTAIVGIAAWLLGSLNMWHYFHDLLRLPGYVWLSVYGLSALGFTAAVLLFRALLRRGAAWRGVVAFPALLVTLDYLMNLSSPHGTAGSLSYTQLKFLPVLQLASITGPWGISFLLLLFPAAIAASVHLRTSSPRQALRVAGALGLLVMAVIGFGAVRLMKADSGPQVRVGLITSDLAANVDVAKAGDDAARLLRDYATRVEQLAAQGPQVIVLPEKLAVVMPSTVGEIDKIFQGVANRTNTSIVVGVVRVAGLLKYNEARMYEPGRAPVTYDKHHMLPPFESDLTPGTTLTILPKQAMNWGVEICKDMDFTPLSRQYGQTRAGLMLVPAWDFNLDRSWHGHMAIMRGVEDGFSIVRAAKQGYLTVSDSRGRVLAEARSNSAPFVTLITEVPAGHKKTLYLALGDWFAWFTMALLIGATYPRKAAAK